MPTFVRSNAIGIPVARRAARAALVALSVLVVGNAFAIGGQFGMEFAIDAPWRIEPVQVAPGRYEYPAIPITIVFHDTIFEDGRGTLASAAFSKIAVGRLVSVRVEEIGTNQPPVTDIPAGALQEIEVKRDLSLKAAEPFHQVCRPSAGQDCSALLAISPSHEWHAVLWFRPKTPVTPGRNIYLKVTATTIGKQLATVRVANGFVQVQVDVPKHWTNYLAVHAGDAPLPRFGDDWLYGDLHYHSQMTDNEGESAYSYRNVARALGASGLDFVFATDHASNGEQVDGKVGGKMEARDLNRARFGVAKSIIYGPDGANSLIGNEARNMGFPRVRTARVVPQVYMGEEIDAWPEMSPAEFASGFIYFGDLALYGGGLKYGWLRKQPEFEHCTDGNSYETCRSRYGRAANAARDSYLLFDDQGVPVAQEIDDYVPPLGSILGYGGWIPDSVKPYPSRQHIVYFPVDSSLASTGWIGSDTGRFGGASKRLGQVAAEIQSGGVAFLAHPVEDLEPGSISGPDVVPYTQQSLALAWANPAILGLQFWNENDRYRSAPTALDPTVVASKVTTTSQGIPTLVEYTYRWPFPGYFPSGVDFRWQQSGFLARGIMGSTFNKLHHGAATWDRFLRKGLDPRQTAALSWLPAGEPRKWYMAGGSDSHGDWNYRRYGRPSPSKRWSDAPVGDTAIGNPRNLVSMRGPRLRPELAEAIGDSIGANPDGDRRYSNVDVIGALRAGRFSVTDGPALRIVVDRNLNGRVDDDDLPMGSKLEYYPGDHIPILVEWFSTPEFGPIDQVDIYVGNANETFAAKGHGSRLLPFYINQAANLTEDYGGYAHDPSGALQIRLADSVGRFSLSNQPERLRYHGVARIYLGPRQFRLATGDGALSYVRAFARTITDFQAQDNALCAPVGTAGSKCGDRFAFSNPVWASYQVSCPATPRRPAGAAGGLLGLSNAFIDADGNGVPDTCERDLPNPCTDPRHPELGVDVDLPVATEGDEPRQPPGRRGDEARTGPDISLPVDSRPERPRPTKPVPNTSCKILGLAGP